MGSMFNTALWGSGIPAGTVTVTARGLIYGALRLLGVLRPGSVENTDSDADGLTWLNELVDSWATERLMVKVIARNLITMNGSASYTATPQRIEGAGYVDSGGTTEYPLEVYRQGEWQGVVSKVQAGSPEAVAVDYAMPEAIVTPWPQPLTGDLVLYQWVILGSFDALDTVYGLPAGYALALRFCLADQIAPAFAIITKIPDPQLKNIAVKAAEYKGKVKSFNTFTEPMVFDNPFGSGVRSDIMSGIV